MSALETFWQKHPALLYGLGMLLGISLAYNAAFYLALPLGLLFIASRQRAALLLLFILFSVAYARLHVSFPEAFESKLTARFKIDTLTEGSTHFGQQWLYKGSLFIPPELKRVPITIVLPMKKEISRPAANRDYLVQGVFSRNKQGRYVFKIDRQEPWLPVLDTYSFAEKRYQLKKTVIQHIKKSIPDTASATFLAGLATGYFDDRHMSADFSRFGLQHIMAISGFHFSIIASFLSSCLGLIVTKRKAVLLTIFLLTSYFLFLGCSASILRAWIAILIALCAILFEREGQSLNSLGLGLIAVLAYDPLLYNNLGFQFSFLTTASILLFYPIMDKAMLTVFEKRSLEQSMKMNYLNQHGYIILTFLRQALALTVAVNLTAFPMTLFYFGEYPVLGMVYNIFFPFLVSISMLLLMLGIILPFIHPLNSSYTKFLLGFTGNIPRHLDTKISAYVSAEWLVVYLSVLFFLSIALIYRRKDRIDFLD